MVNCEICGRVVLHGVLDYELYFCHTCKGTMYICQECAAVPHCTVCNSSDVKSVLQQLTKRSGGHLIYGQLKLSKELLDEQFGEIGAVSS